MTTKNTLRNKAIPDTTILNKGVVSNNSANNPNTKTNNTRSPNTTHNPNTSRPTTSCTTTHKTYSPKRVTPDVSKPDTYEFFPLEQPNFPEWDFDLADLDSNYLILDQATPKGKDPFKDKETPSIFFAASVYKEMMYIAQKAAKKGTEIGGIMLIKQVQDMYPQFVAYDHFMVGQEVTSVRVEMDNDDLVRHANHLREKFPEVFGSHTHRQFMHWHLHPNMGVSFSSTDTAQQEGRDKLGFRDDYRFYVCVNEKGDINIEMIQYYPVFHRFKDVNVGIYYAKNYLTELDKPRKKELDLWMEKLVTRKVQTYGVGVGGYGGSYGSGYGNNYGNRYAGGYNKPSTWDQRGKPNTTPSSARPSSMMDDMYGDTFTPEELEDFRRALATDEPNPNWYSPQDDELGELGEMNDCLSPNEVEKYEMIHDAFYGLNGINDLSLKEMMLSHTTDIIEPLVMNIQDEDVLPITADQKFMDGVYEAFEENEESVIRPHKILEKTVLVLAKAQKQIADTNNTPLSPITAKAMITLYMENLNSLMYELQTGWDFEETSGIQYNDYNFHSQNLIKAVKRAFESYAVKDMDFYAQMSANIEPMDFMEVMVSQGQAHNK